MCSKPIRLFGTHRDTPNARSIRTTHATYFHTHKHAHTHTHTQHTHIHFQCTHKHNTHKQGWCSSSPPRYWMYIVLIFTPSWGIAWLSLCFILETSWVALYSVVCEWVSVSGISNTRPNLHFFQYIQAYKPFADHAPPNTKQYQLILTKYQPVSSYTDPAPSSTTYN